MSLHHAILLRVKRGRLSIATQELLLALQPSPMALFMALRPGRPAAAELARGPGPEDVERLHLTVSQEHTTVEDSRPGATRLEVGPRESRAGSRVPIYTSSSLPCKPRVRAGLYTPWGLSAVGSPLPVPVEAPCSALAVDTAEERLCPCKCGSAMLRAGDKQLGVASRPH